MVYRRDLIEHFKWLEGSEYLDDVLDEALVAIKLTDALIAAPVVEHGLPVVTQDGDYEKLAAAHPALRVLNV